jgi:hypothetical protein
MTQFRKSLFPLFAPDETQLAMSRADIEQLLAEAKERALTFGQIGSTEWRVGEYGIQIIWIISQRVEEQTGRRTPPEQILKFIEDALKDYNFIPRLQTNPLARLIDLRPYRREDDPPDFAKGWALRHALDAAINAIEGSAPQPNPGSLRVERYLSHRYRARLKHYQIAMKTGWSERNLDRLRRELLERMAGILFAPR